MLVTVTLGVPEINVILEGLSRVQENAAYIQNAVRMQVSAQLQSAAEQSAQEASKASEPEAAAPEASTDPAP